MIEKSPFNQYRWMSNDTLSEHYLNVGFSCVLDTLFETSSLTDIVQDESTHKLNLHLKTVKPKMKWICSGHFVVC